VVWVCEGDGAGVEVCAGDGDGSGDCFGEGELLFVGDGVGSSVGEGPAAGLSGMLGEGAAERTGCPPHAVVRIASPIPLTTSTRFIELFLLMD